MRGAFGLLLVVFAASALEAAYVAPDWVWDPDKGIVDLDGAGEEWETEIENPGGGGPGGGDPGDDLGDCGECQASGLCDFDPENIPEDGEGTPLYSPVMSICCCGKGYRVYTYHLGPSQCLVRWPEYDDECGDDCNTPEECVCDLLSQILGALQEMPGGGPGGPGGENPPVDLGVEDSDGDGCPDVIDPEPLNPAVGCGNPAPPESAGFQPGYTLPTVGISNWSHSLELPTFGGESVEWSISTDPQAISGWLGAANVTGWLETFRITLRLILLAGVVVWSIQQVLLTLRQY